MKTDIAEGSDIKHVGVFDIIKDDPCPKCGCSGWIVDGDGKGRYWLLCLAAESDCVETRELPSTVIVEAVVP